MLRIYNWINILARKLTSIFYSGERRLPLLHFTFKKIMDKNFSDRNSFNFIQVGAFDGISHDFLYDFVAKKNAAGIVIEPVTEYFIKLSENYSYNKNIIPLNFAIHDHLNTLTLYCVNPAFLDQLPEWAAGITSANPQHHLKTNIPSEAILPRQVKAFRLMDVIARYYQPKTINLLQIDTEGCDYEILKSFDFTKFVPDIIKIEYVNLTAEDIDGAIRFLKDHGYYCLYDHEDLVGIQLKKVRL